MCRYLLIAVVVALIALMVVAALVVQEYGWQGFLVLLGGLAVLAYLARKAAPRLIKYLMMRPLRKMGAPLRGATIVVHSVTPCDPPPRDEYDPFPGCDDLDDEALEDDEDSEDDQDEDYVETAGPRDWYWIDFTVTPPEAGPSAGRIVHRQAWMPPLIGAVGPRPELERASPFDGWPPAEQFTDAVHNTPAEVWDGEDFADPEAEVFGEQRLRMRVGVTRDVGAVTLTYAHFTDIGRVDLPIIDVTPEETT